MVHCRSHGTGWVGGVITGSRRDVKTLYRRHSPSVKPHASEQLQSVTSLAATLDTIRHVSRRDLRQRYLTAFAAPAFTHTAPSSKNFVSPLSIPQKRPCPFFKSIFSYSLGWILSHRHLLQSSAHATHDIFDSPVRRGELSEVGKDFSTKAVDNAQ